MDKSVDAEYWQLVWNKFKSGDKTAFKTIYVEYVDSLFSYGARITTDRELLKDAIQDLFINVYTYGSNLRKPELLEFYLFKTLKRIIIRKLSEKQHFSSIQETPSLFNLIFSIEEESFNEEDDEAIQLLQQEVSELKPSKRELLFLKFNSNLSYVEIGRLLDLNPDTVKKQVYRILKQLRRKIGAKIAVLLLMCSKT
ncbi:sigma-70 family RNA polymerase sigma factor [Draconibacterium sp. IB214405]|uniref:RNA polymerase sigma factor n=1 Tax=Draconibacterium sp. IB214405 TaxID=3097352 RepID=UPI002A164CD2|nr:sigma-70 family RNA polymerase sigma factor [Draconibacterium sp. IB214405]MDX8339396.1 sigma-70 family RNA polymerase sigma factor [Draconibacterium sp. IB214405]